MPLLVIVGSEDLPESRLEAFEGLQPNLQYNVNEGATHGGAQGAVKHPDIGTIIDFLAKNSGP